MKQALAPARSTPSAEGGGPAPHRGSPPPATARTGRPTGGGRDRLAPEAVRRTLGRPGRPLDASTRAELEPRTGMDLGQVRVHADPVAGRSAASVGARAYAVGRDIVFGPGEYRPGTESTRALLHHELAHAVQQRMGPAGTIPTRVPLGDPGGPAEAEASAFARGERTPLSPSPLRLQRVPNPANVCLRPGGTERPDAGIDCDVLHPGNCPTYEMWVQTFDDMNAFTADDTAPGGTPTGQQVLGDVAADIDRSTATTTDDPAPPVRPRLSDRFVDRPTDSWVRRCLPPNLRATAYQLPSDCADIAIILRHVWLAAHRRTETYTGVAAGGVRRTWVIGDRAGRAAQRRVGRVIAQVGTGNLSAMVAPYTDAAGRPLRTLAELEDRLHPGDIMVWEHRRGRRRTGGHAHTIQAVRRSGGHITGVTMLQGNLPIGAAQAAEIRADTGTRNPSPGSDPLRREPGRRIERATLVPGVDIADDGNVLKWHGSSVLLVAGPPRSARRPRRRGATRSVSDWHGSIRSARERTLPGILEGALQEARSVIEGGQPFTAAEAETLGRIAGERVWALARRSVRAGRDFGERSHFDLLHRLQATIRALGGIHPPRPASEQTPQAATVRSRFGAIDAAFQLAARGISGVALDRRVPGGVTLLKFLVTGFDPFRGGGAPLAGEWNPSGAAALRLDGRTERIGPRSRTSIESAVMPVSFERFRGGMVESLVGRARGQGVDAIVTTSLDPSIQGTQPVRIEQFAVGVHNLGNLRTHRLMPEERTATPGREAIPAAPGGSVGPRIAESTTDTGTLAAGLGSAGGQRRAVQGVVVELELGSTAEATAAFQALGLSTPSSTRRGATIGVGDVTAVQRLMSASQSIRGGRGIRFTAGGQTFDANILRGPGGSFLSNEISYRTLRAIAGTDIQSFHVHTPTGNRITGTGAARRSAMRTGRRTLARLVDTLLRIIKALGRRILAARGQTP